MTRGLAIGLCVSAVLLGGCSGSGRQATNPDNEQWFCQSDLTGDGWDCVQDNNLARVPVPTRLPPEPQPPASEVATAVIDAPAEDIADLSLDPREELARMQAQQQAAATQASPVADESVPPADSPAPTEATRDDTPSAEATTSDAVPSSAAAATSEAAAATPSDPASAAAPPPAPAPAADSTPPTEVPKHVRLAYVPPEPTPILELPPEYFVVQVLAMGSKELVEEYVAEHQLRGMSAARVENDGELYYVLVLGIYTTLERAQEAASDLPPPLDTAEPWIRPLGSLQAAMRRADQLAGTAVF